jgi:hypothetical protein
MIVIFYFCHPKRSELSEYSECSGYLLGVPPDPNCQNILNFATRAERNCQNIPNVLIIQICIRIEENCQNILNLHNSTNRGELSEYSRYSKYSINGAAASISQRTAARLSISRIKAAVFSFAAPLHRRVKAATLSPRPRSA